MKDDLIDLEIEKMVYEGYGLSHYNGKVVFVDGVCDGDICTVKVERENKNCIFAKLENLKKPSMYRVEPFCPLHNACGGCQWQFIDYEYQLEVKRKIVEEIINKTLKSNITVDKTLPSPEMRNFRYKVQMPVSQTKNSKRFLIGYYKKNTHEITNIKYCPIQPKIIDEIVEDVRNTAFEIGVESYNEAKHKGELRHIIFRMSQNTGDILICMVVNNSSISKPIRNLAQYLYDNYEKVKGVSVNFNQNKNNVILGNKTFTIIGQDSYTEKIGDISYLISAESFFQVNPQSFKNILDKIKSLIKSNTNKPEILDAYSGVGSFGLYLSDIAKKVTCVEEVEKACKNAKDAIILNDIKNVEILNGDAQKVFEKLIGNNKKFDVVILDPPRKGCSEKSLEYCVKLSKKYVVYVSCNPNSLARDLKYLQANGFELKYVQTADMFCHTYHIETIAFIEKKDCLR